MPLEIKKDEKENKDKVVLPFLNTKTNSSKYSLYNIGKSIFIFQTTSDKSKKQCQTTTAGT